MRQQDIFNEPYEAEKRPRKKAESAVVFKSYNQNQLMLLPEDISEMIPSNHLVRVLDATIDGLNIDPLLATYEGGGASAYHPKMLLKVLLYGYLNKIYSSRRIAKALRQDIHFMWLSAMSHPDFRTINGFRSGRLKDIIDQIFSNTVLFLIDHGYVDLSEYFVDGTKIRADNNKHKVVWCKNTARYKEMVQKKIIEQLKEIDRINDQENQRYDDRDLEELGEDIPIDSEALKEHIKKINEKIKNDPNLKKCQKSLKKIEKEYLPKLDRYEEQERLLNGRNSYGKTDPDSTVFFSKDGQLVPAYNILMGTQNQFIVNYSFNQRKASESDGFINHMKHLQNQLHCLPQLAMGDSAYGSEENYNWLAENKIGNYLKYNTFHKEKTRKYRSDPYRKENFLYDQASDVYTCSQGRLLVFKEIQYRKTLNGYQISFRVYQCVNCDNCPVAVLCKRGESPRSIRINPILDQFRKQAQENLDSERGIELRKHRSIDVEPAFGDLKFNQSFQRFNLRGLDKANVEYALLSICHNTKKLALIAN